jgi:hypothetical protein
LYKKGFAREGKSESIKIKGKLTSYFKINFNSCFCSENLYLRYKSKGKRDESNVIFKLREIRNFSYLSLAFALRIYIFDINLKGKRG